MEDLVDYSWMRLAACRNKTELFFLEQNGQNLTKARKICAECPVQIQCRDYGDRLRTATPPISKGLWGGMTVEELWIASAQGQTTQDVCQARGCSDLVPLTMGTKRPRIYCSPACARREVSARYSDRNRLGRKLKRKVA